MRKAWREDVKRVIGAMLSYQHAFHAGNHADCLKHALLLRLLDALKRKETPFA